MTRPTFIACLNVPNESDRHLLSPAAVTSWGIDGGRTKRQCHMGAPMSQLTPKQEEFCKAIVKGQKFSDAYRVAFEPKTMTKKTINEKASRLARMGKIGARIGELRAPAVKVLQIDLARRMQELGHAALLDPIDLFDGDGRLRAIREIPEHARRAIAGIEVDPESFVTKLKLIDKRGAIMDYTKLAGDMPVEKHDVTGHLTVEALVLASMGRNDPKDITP
jgi:hypothetical protein